MSTHDIYDAILEVRNKIDDALERLVRLEALLGGRQAPAPAAPRSGPGGDRFNYADRLHRMTVEELFKKHDINDKRQGWFLNRRLTGVRLGDVAGIIEEENAEYLRKYPPRPFRVGKRDGTKSNWDGGWRG